MEYISACVVLMPSGHCCIVKRPLCSEVLPGVSTVLVLGFRFSLVFCVYPSPSVIEGSGYDGPMPEDVGWCTRGHSPPQSRGLAAWDSICGALIKCTSEDMSDVVPCWYHMGGELSAAVVALSPFTLRGSSIDALAGNVVSVKVHRLMKADCMAVFGGCGCVVFSFDPRASDLEYKITDLRGVNLFDPLPFTVSVLPGI